VARAARVYASGCVCTEGQASDEACSRNQQVVSLKKFQKTQKRGDK